MDLVSLCPLRVASFVWRRGPTGFTRTVVCKATYELLPERARLADPQEPLHEADEHWDGDPERSLYAPADLVPRKARADVVLVGRAFAPGNEPRASVLARLVVGTLDKTVEVHCDRAWSEAGQLLEGPRFTSMPLLYERAAGGPGTWNPVGVRADARPGADGLARLPNLVPPGFKPSARGARISPVGFGPIAPAWPNRLAKFGPHASLARELLRELPEDLDEDCFNAAPKDQQLSALRPDERIVMENLDPHHPRLSTALPGLRPRVWVDAGGTQQEIAMAPDTLWIDTDRRMCTLTWRGTLPVEGADAEGRLVVAVEEPGQSLAWVDVAARSELADVESTHVETLDDETEITLRPSRERRPALPFQPAVAPPPPPPPPAQVAGPSPPEPSRLPGARPQAPRAPRVSRFGPWAPPGSASEASGAPVLSALALSNAAAAAGGAPAAPLGAAADVPRPRPSDVLEMLWCDPAFMPRIRARPAWSRLLASVKPSPRDDEGAAGDKAKEAKDLRDARSIVRHGEALDAAGLDAALEAATEDGTFAPPLVLAAGDVVLPFDERETLKATLALVAPFAGADKKLRELCDTARELLASPWLEKGAAGLDGFVASLREAFAKSARGVSPGSLEAQGERILLEQRRYQRRTLLGEEWVRALLTPPGAEHAIPLYLPEAAARQLPMFTRFRARVLAELRLQLDQHEPSEIALRAVALGRLMTPPRRSGS